MEDLREQEIKDLARKSLKVPKDFRLIAEDGKIHLPPVPDKFYFNEIATWLSHAPEFAKENAHELELDYTVESIGYDTKAEIDFDFYSSKAGVYSIPKSKTFTSVQLCAPLNIEQLLKHEFTGAEIGKHSLSHHNFLFHALRKIKENHTAFFEILAEKLEMPLRKQTYYNDVLKVLRKINREIIELEEKQQYNIIPKLYALRDHGLLMSTDINNVFKCEIEEWGLLYTYVFSQNTSYAVFTLLKNFFARHINRYETLLGKSLSEVPDEAPKVVDDERRVLIPSGTKEKTKLLAEILKLEDNIVEGEEDKIAKESSLDPFQVMLLLRALQDKKCIRPKIDKYYFGLAYEILTGGSSSYFQKQYRTDEINAVKLKKWSKKAQLKKAIESVTQLKAKMLDDIIPRLTEFENIKSLNENIGSDPTQNIRKP